MQQTDSSTETATSVFPFSPLTETGLAIQINDRASFLTYQVGAGQALNPAVVAEAKRVYEMCVAHTNRELAILRSVS